MATGIDIGKAGIYLCRAQETPPTLWPVSPLSLAGDWWSPLEQAIPPGEIVALEPTGWHLSRPIVAVILRAGGRVLEVTHQAAAATRKDRLGREKSDEHDARALAIKALDAERGHPSAGMREIDNDDTGPLAIAIRLNIAARTRAMHDRVASLNRLGTIAHGLWPVLGAHVATYRRFIARDAVTPSEIVALWSQIAAGQEPCRFRGRAVATARNMAALCASAPPVSPVLRDVVAQIAGQINRDDLEIDHAAGQLEQLIHDPLIEPITAAWLSVPFASPYRVATLHGATRCRAPEFTADEFRAACGCHPVRQESGAYSASGEAKHGYRPAKAALHLWTMNMLSRDNAVARYFRQQKARKNRYAIHSARGKFSRILSALSRHPEPWADNPSERNHHANSNR